MIIINDEQDSRKDYLMVGVAEGKTTQTSGTGSDSASGKKKLEGEELRAYRKRMDEGRRTAEKEMIEAAKKMGADAIVCVRYSSAPGEDGGTEVIASGTAVKYR